MEIEKMKYPKERAIEIIDNLVPPDRKVTMRDINSALDNIHITDDKSRSRIIPDVADHYHGKNRLDWMFSERPSQVIRSSYRTELMAPKEDEE
jgi:hypothetical protein